MKALHPSTPSVAILLSLLLAGPLFAAGEAKPGPAQPVVKKALSTEDLAKIKKEREERMENDWPWLGKYREANAALTAPASNENRVVFMGNSITEGWSVLHPEFFANKPYINRGISGQTTPQMLVRFRQDVVNLKPRVVVINAGVNDIAGNTGPSTLEMIEDNLASMVEIAKANNITVVLASVIPAFDFPWSPGKQPAEKIVALNEWLKAYAQKNKLVYLDYHSAMKDERNGLKAEYTKPEDGVHPTLAGYKVMEPLVEKAIDQALKKK